MALFQGKNTLKPDSRSRIGALIVGHHSDPSEDWVTDPDLPVLLKNPYGGPGFEDVVVPMGRLIAVGEPVKVSTGKFKTKLTLANGTNPVVGVAPYNFTKDQSFNDRFGGNKPAIIVDRYIRLPYIPDSTNSSICPWGHVTGADITVGHFLKPTANGQFTKWVEGVDSITQRVGQVLAKDFNQEAMGWQKMAMWAEEEKMNDEIYQNYYNKTPNTGNSTFPMDLGYPYTGEYRDGLKDMTQYGYMSQYQQQFSGIPGLTDGSGRQLTRHSNKALGSLPAAGITDGDNFSFFIKDDAGNNAINIINSLDVDKKFVLKVDGVVKTAGLGNGQYQINYKTGQIIYKALAAEVDMPVTVDFCMHYYGTQTYIDFQGAIGVLNILLKL